jgi:poly(3-hydroxybutyrate) depolymerase
MIALANVRVLLFTLVLGMTEAAQSAAQVTARADSLYSASLGHTMRFVVVLPDGYDSTGSYPVLWLLHGYGGNDSDWLNNTQLTHYLRAFLSSSCCRTGSCHGTSTLSGTPPPGLRTTSSWT